MTRSAIQKIVAVRDNEGKRVPEWQTKAFWVSVLSIVGGIYLCAVGQPEIGGPLIIVGTGASYGGRVLR